MSTPKKPLTVDDERHGTYAGALAHRAQDVPMCEPCRVARNAYMKARRKSGKVSYPDRAKARARALTRLSHLHADDFRRLYAEEAAPITRGGAA